jgi:hypothetical protein
LQLPEDVAALVLRFLDATDVVRASTVAQAWRAGAASGWESRCEDLWRGKVCVPHRFRDAAQKTAIEYFGSIRDATRCRFASAKELCEQHFHFRFRRGAGNVFWAGFSAGEVPMYRRFTEDGQLQSRPPPEASTPGHPAHSPFAVAPATDPLETDPEFSSVALSVRWKFTQSKHGRRGQYIMLNSWPSYTTRRNVDDWGWVLESDWVLYRSCCPETVAMGPAWLSSDGTDDDDSGLESAMGSDFSESDAQSDGDWE